jgi:hypothetical protein
VESVFNKSTRDTTKESSNSDLSADLDDTSMDLGEFDLKEYNPELSLQRSSTKDLNLNKISPFKRVSPKNNKGIPPTRFVAK